MFSAGKKPLKAFYMKTIDTILPAYTISNLKALGESKHLPNKCDLILCNI